MWCSPGTSGRPAPSWGSFHPFQPVQPSSRPAVGLAPLPRGAPSGLESGAVQPSSLSRNTAGPAAYPDPCAARTFPIAFHSPRRRERAFRSCTRRVARALQTSQHFSRARADSPAADTFRAVPRAPRRDRLLPRDGTSCEHPRLRAARPRTRVRTRHRARVRASSATVLRPRTTVVAQSLLWAALGRRHCPQRTRTTVWFGFRVRVFRDGDVREKG